MNDFLTVLEQHSIGALVLVFLLLILLFLIREVFWLMGWGRYAKIDRGGQANVTIPGVEDPSRVWSFFATRFVAKTISEFRHLLALLIFLLFAGAVILSILPGLLILDVDRMSEGLEGVAAALGGLVGSIIGYYFGEQVGSATNRTTESGESRGEAIQDGAEKAPIQLARIPGAPAPTDNPETKP